MQHGKVGKVSIYFRVQSTEVNWQLLQSIIKSFGNPESCEKERSTSKIVEWEKKKRAKRTKNVLQCPMC